MTPGIDSIPWRSLVVAAGLLVAGLLLMGLWVGRVREVLFLILMAAAAVWGVVLSVTYVAKIALRKKHEYESAIRSVVDFWR